MAIGAVSAGYAIQQSTMASKRTGTLQGQSAAVEKAQMSMAQENEKTQAAQDELERQRTLKRVLASQNAVFGSSGAGLGSGSFIGIQTADVSRASEATRLNQLFSDTRNVGYQINKANAQFNLAANLSANQSMRRANAIRTGSGLLQTGLKGYGGYTAYKGGDKESAAYLFGTNNLG
jgi:hypothetical protein